MKKSFFVSGALLVASQSYAGFVSVNQALAPQAGVRVMSSFAQNPNRLKLQYTSGGFLLEDKGVESYISMKGASSLHERGRPDVPVIRYEVEVPSSQIQLKVTSSRSSILSAQEAGLVGQVTASLGSVEKIPGSERIIKQNLDQSAYDVNEFYPNSIASIVSMGTVRGRHLATIEIRPLQYNPVTREIKFFDLISIDVENLAKNTKKPQQMSSVDEALNKSLHLNMYVSGSEPQREKMIVIVADSLSENAKLNQYLAAKSTSGVSVEKVLASQAGATDVAIRNYLRAQYQASQNSNTALSYVMFVGDVELVATHDAGSEFTDNYFASLDKDDYKTDIMYPEVSVGRLAVKTQAELDVVMNKYLKYQAARFPNNDWIKKIAFLATNDRYTVAEGTHNYVIDSYTKGLNYSGNFPSLPELGGDKLYAITHRANQSNVVRSINEGRILVSYSGHGAPTYWDAPRVNPSDVQAIPANDAYPYVMSHACVSGSYGMDHEDSFGEVWLKAPNAAIGFFGTSNNSYWDEDDVLEKVFFDGMFKNGVKSVGQLNQFGLAGVRQVYGNVAAGPYYYSIYNLLGDPSLELFKSKPVQKPLDLFSQILKF